MEAKNENQNKEKPEDLETLEKKMSFLDSFLSIDGKNKLFEEEEEDIKTSKENEEKKPIFIKKSSESKNKKNLTLKEFFNINSKHKKKRFNTNPFHKEELKKSTLIILMMAMGIAFLLCFLLGIHKLVAFFLGICFVGYIIKNRKVLLQGNIKENIINLVYDFICFESKEVDKKNNNLSNIQEMNKADAYNSTIDEFELCQSLLNI